MPSSPSTDDYDFEVRRPNRYHAISHAADAPLPNTTTIATARANSYAGPRRAQNLRRSVTFDPVNCKIAAPTSNEHASTMTWALGGEGVERIPFQTKITFGDQETRYACQVGPDSDHFATSVGRVHLICAGPSRSCPCMRFTRSVLCVWAKHGWTGRACTEARILCVL